MKSTGKSGFALLTVLFFAALMLPIVVILLSLVATQTQYPRAEIAQALSAQLSLTGLREAEVSTLDRPYQILYRCDDVQQRANDQYLQIYPYNTPSYIGSFWIRYPFLTPVRYYDSNAGNYGNRAAGSLVVYPSLLFQLDDLTDANCVPDNLNVAARFTPSEQVLLALPFMPFGKRFYAFSELNSSGSLGDTLWSGNRYNPGNSLNWKPWQTPAPQPLLGILSSFLSDPSRWGYEFYLSGDTAKEDVYVNPYQREPYGKPASFFDPLAPAEGVQIPVQNQTLLDPSTSQPVVILPSNTRFDLQLGSIPTGYETVVLDEDSLLPLYDYFHNPDDAHFYNPVHNDDPPSPFRGIYEVIGQFTQSRLEQAYRQQVRTLSWLAPGIGPSRSEALLSHQAYYDIGDPGSPGGNQPNNLRDDFDNNNWVDEVQRPFPRSLKEILDVRGVRDIPGSNAPITRPAFLNLVPLVTLYSHDLAYSQESGVDIVLDPILASSTGRNTAVNLWTPLSSFPDYDIPGADNPCTLPPRPDGIRYPQDCLIPQSAPLSVASYNTWRAIFGSFDPAVSNAWMDPAVFGGMLISLNSTVASDLNNILSSLSFFTILYPDPWDDIIAGRIVGHLAAWQYFFRYTDSACHLLWNTSSGREWTHFWMEEHSRYHGLGDLLMPVPPPGTAFDPGNSTDVPGCGGNRQGDSSLFPTLYVPVDRNNNGTFDPPNPNNPYQCQPARDCYMPLIDDSDGDGEILGFDPAFWVPDRMPSTVLLDNNRMRLSDETVLFEVAATFLDASSPYRTYFDSSAGSKISNGVPPDPDPVNDVCDPMGRYVQPGGDARMGAYYPADGRNQGNFACATNPNTWPEQDPLRWRPFYSRGRININTAPFPVLRALMAKTMDASVVTDPNLENRARIFPLALLKYREIYYFDDTLPSVDDWRQSTADAWLAYNAFPDPFDFFYPYYGSSLLTSYFLKRFEITGQGFHPYPTSVDERLRRKMSLPHEIANPPFRNVAQLLDVARVEDVDDDPRNVIANPRALAMDCWRGCVFTYSGGSAPLSASVFARIDQDITVSSSAFRFHSLGRFGSAQHGKTSIVRLLRIPSLGSVFQVPAEKEWVVKDDVDLFHRYY
ncbi:MAG: hypothetical protein V2G48_05505 [bacterium JZ-2024 1]